MAMLISLVSFAQDAPVYELVPKSGSNNSYAGNCDITIDGIKWNLTGNSTMQPWRLGGKSITNQDRALYSKTPLAYNIDKIEVTHGTASGITVNSFKLIISDEANGAGETIDVAFKASATTTIDLPEGDYTDKYFKFLYNVTNSTSNNKFVQFTGAKFYAALAEDAVKAPVITGAEDFISETEVTIEAEDDVTVYYTLDGTEPTTASTVYTAPFTVKETTTVKAIAYRGETASFVTSATFTQATRVTAAEAAQLAMKVASNNALTSVTYVIDAYVTSVIDQTLSSGQQRFWVADTKDGGQVLQSYYCNVPQVLKVGDYIQMFGKLTKYNTAPQMKNGDVTILPEPVVNHTITVSANPAEGGTVTGGGEFEETDEISVKAVANEGYEFVNWTENEVEVSTDAEYTFEVLADRALVANFKVIPCTQAIAINWDEAINAEANADKWYAVNIASAKEAAKDLELTVSNPGEEAVKVTVEVYADCPATMLIAESTATINAGASKTKTIGYFDIFADLVDVIYFHVITEGGEIKVEAETAKFNVTATAENGTVEGAGVYEQGTEATLTATPAEGYEFVNWTVDGTEVSTENPYKFTVTADVALVANFKKAAPAMETVYFINNKGWSKVNAYAWEPVQNANWPGVAATKEAEQIGGYDVYSYTADAGKYANVIFNNGSGSQTADLKWTAGKYVINNQWYTKEEAEAQLVKPVEYEYVYFVNVQAWNKVNIYTWTPEVGTWPGVAMTKEAEQLAGYDVYSYKAEKGTSFGGVIFNNGSGVQTGDLKWTAGKYYVKDGWYTKEEAIEKLSVPVTPPVITYVLMGIAGDWTTGIALTVNPDNENEYVLLGQEIAEGDAVKVVTLTDGVATAWCGNVDPASAAYTADDMGNIVLAPGKYDFYFKVKEDLIYIGAVKPEVITYELNGGEFPAVVVPTNAELWEAFKPYYNEYYGLARADQPIDKVTTFASAKMQEIMTDEASEYKWLGDYVQSVATAAGVPLSTDMASANESGWRWAVHAFFNAAAGQYGATGIDFTEAGKQEVWGAAYEAEYGVVLPTEPVAEDYVLPTPTKEGYIFVGWYDNAEGTGEPYKVIPAGWAGTLYAIWKQDTTTALDNIAVEGKAVKAIINGQLIIIKNGVQYNAQGVILK